VTYYGEEIGMTDVCVTVDPSTAVATRCITAEPFIREFCRSPFQWDASTNAGFSNGSISWLPPANDYERVNLAAQQGRAGSHFEIYKQLMALKKSDVGTNGTMSIEALNDDVFLIKRQLNNTVGDGFLAIFNLSPQFYSFELLNKRHLPIEMKVALKRSNSLHQIGSTIKVKSIQLQPYDLLIGTYTSGTAVFMSNFFIVALIILKIAS